MRIEINGKMGLEDLYKKVSGELKEGRDVDLVVNDGTGSTERHIYTDNEPILVAAWCASALILAMREELQLRSANSRNPSLDMALINKVAEPPFSEKAKRMFGDYQSILEDLRKSGAQETPRSQEAHAWVLADVQPLISSGSREDMAPKAPHQSPSGAPGFRHPRPGL